MAPLLEVKNLHTSFTRPEGVIKAVDGISYAVERGETLGIVGESGSGKTVTAMSILRLLPGSAVYPSGAIYFNGKDCLRMDDEDIRKIRGNRISVVFQQPMTSLNPLHRVGKQIKETLFLHQAVSNFEAHQKALSWLDRVGLKNPAGKLSAFPHQ
ncbi:MAG: ATP-binding cassette domain-containing protein, partial [Desulfosarcina sp.]